LSDEEIAEKEVDQANVLGQIEIDSWRDVLAVEGRGVLLMVAARAGWPAVVVYLDGIRGRGATKKGEQS
jgi:hypothetical protein